jgi:hypothetical protein
MRHILTLLTLTIFCAPVSAQGTINSKPGFIENKGQIAEPTVLFKTAGIQQGMYVTTSGLTHVFTKTMAPSSNEDALRTREVQWSKVEMLLQGAVIKKENIEASAEQAGYTNYYYAHCPQGVLNVKTYEKVIVHSVYPGIDWVLNANEKGIAHDFIVHPGADPSIIKLVYKGAHAIEMQENKLKITTPYGTLYEGDLNTYTTNGKAVPSSFTIKNTEVSFSLGTYDTKETVVIDPPLQWASQQLSTGMDYAWAVSSPGDGSGHVCVTGFTDATNFPTSNAYQGTLAANEDMFVMRLSAGGAVLWSTYYGGSDYEGGKGIATDNAGNCYVAGYTGSTDFPTANAIQSIYGNGTYDAAILKFNNAGVRQWATFYGGLNFDYANAIDSDANGNIYITGYTNSSSFPTVNPIQATKNTSYDAFVMKIDSTASVSWATFFGGDDEDKARAIALDASGTHVHITGTTLSAAFPTQAGGFQTNNASAYFAEEGFITKFNASNAAVQFSTFCGGSDADFAQGIAVDASGNVYITGYTFSPNFHIVNPGQGAYVDSTLGSAGTHDAFIFETNSTGSTKLWSSYIGGSSVDLAFAIAWHPSFGIYITGRTSSTDFPVMMPSDMLFYQSTHGDGGNFSDMFITWFNNHNMMWSTFYGNGDDEEAYGITTDTPGNIFVAGVDSLDAKVIKFEPGIVMGINAAAEESFGLYPDPASDVLYASFESTAQQTELRIINLQGQAVRTIDPNGSKMIKISLDGIAPGVYILEVKQENGIIQKKFVKI